MSKLLKCWETECQWSTSMYDKINSYQKAAFRVEEAVSQLYLTTPHSPLTPPSLPPLLFQIITMAILWHMPAKQLCETVK